MKRKIRYLKGNFGVEAPSQWVFVDTETVEEKGVHRLRLGVATAYRQEKGRFSRRQECRFTTQPQFWDWLERQLDRKRTTVLVAHNAPFDLSVLGFWWRLETREIKLRYGVFDSPPFLADCVLDGSRLRVIDSRNWFRCSLSELGAGLGMPKLEMPAMNAHVGEWWAYCVRDVEILEQSVKGLVRWVRDNDLGVLRLTLGAQAMGAYRHRLAPRIGTHGEIENMGQGGGAGNAAKCLPMLHASPEALRLERASYYGGRVECFRIGQVNGPIHCLDANSLYPSLYAAHSYPCRLIDYITGIPVSEVASLAKAMALIASVKIICKRNVYPVRNGNRTIMATGVYNTVLAGPELSRAVLAGDVAIIHSAALYESQPILRLFALEFLSLRARERRRRNGVFESLAKSMANALHGKFGQHATRWKVRKGEESPRDWGDWYRVDADTRRVTHFRAVGWLVQERQPAGESASSFPAIPAFVAAYARERLRGWIESAGADNVYYCCTDAIHVNDDGLAALTVAGEISPDAPGKLRLERTVSAADYRGIGHYYLDGERILAGVPAHAEMGASGCYQWPRFSSMGDVLSEGGQNVPRRQMKRVRHAEFYRHGVVSQDGRVSPYVLGAVDKAP